MAHEANGCRQCSGRWRINVWTNWKGDIRRHLLYMYAFHGIPYTHLKLTFSHDLRRRFRNCRCCNRIERRIGPRNMYRRFRCCCNCPWFLVGERTNAGQDLMVGLDRTCLHLGSNFHRHDIRWSTGPTRFGSKDWSLGNWIPSHWSSLFHGSFIRHLRFDSCLRRYTHIVSLIFVHRPSRFII